MGIIDLPGVRLWLRRKTDDLTRENSWHTPGQMSRRTVVETGGRPVPAQKVDCLFLEPGDQDIFLRI